MKSEQIEKALAVLAAAQHSYEEGMLHTCDSLVNEALKQLMDYQSLRLFDQRNFNSAPDGFHAKGLLDLLPKVLGD